MATFYTRDFEPVQATGCIAFCDARDESEAREILRQAMVDGGCKDPGTSFAIVKLPPAGRFCINGDY